MNCQTHKLCHSSSICLTLLKGIFHWKLFLLEVVLDKKYSWWGTVCKKMLKSLLNYFPHPTECRIWFHLRCLCSSLKSNRICPYDTLLCNQFKVLCILWPWNSYLVWQKTQIKQNLKKNHIVNTDHVTENVICALRNRNKISRHVRGKPVSTLQC